MNTLVSTEELAQHPEWRVFDCRHDLAQPALGEQQYLEAHIPGAVFAHRDRDLSRGANGLSWTGRLNHQRRVRCAWPPRHPMTG